MCELENWVEHVRAGLEKIHLGPATRFMSAEREKNQPVTGCLWQSDVDYVCEKSGGVAGVQRERFQRVQEQFQVGGLVMSLCRLCTSLGWHAAI